MLLRILQLFNIANRPQFSLVYACINHRIDIKMSVQNSSGTIRHFEVARETG